MLMQEVESPGVGSVARPAATGPPAVAVAGVILVESLYILWIALRGFFFEDDFVDLTIVRQLGLNGRMLEQPVFGHFVPGYNLVNYFIASVVPYRWSFVVAIEVALFALSLFLLNRLLRILFGSTWTGLVLVALAGASFSLVPSIVWWASGLQQLMAIPAILLTILCHVSYLSSGRIRFAVLAGVAFVVALAFYDGALGAALFILLLTLLFWPVRPGLGGAVRGLFAYWPAWASLAIPMVLDLAWRFSHYSMYATPPLPHAGQALEFVSLSWTQTFIPLFVGLDTWLLPNHVERVVAGIAGQLAIIGFIVWTIRRRVGAWRAWLVFGITFLFMESLVGLTRVSLIGPGAASDSRYVALNVYFFLISIGFSLLPLRAESRYRERAPERVARRPSHGRRSPKWTVAGLAAVCVIVVAYGGVLIWDQNHLSEVQLDFGSRQFFGKFAQSWPPAGSQKPFVWDTEINPLVVSASFYPYDTAQLTLGKINGSVHFDDWGGQGYVVQSDGSVVAAPAVTKATGTVPPSGACQHTDEHPSGIAVGLNHALPPGQWFGVVSYQSSTGAASVETGTPLTFPKGSGSVLTTFSSSTPFDTVTWVVPPHTDLCITGLRIVVPKAPSSS
jgi:hypothetical protein